MLNFGQVCNVILEKIDKFFIFFVVFFNGFKFKND